MRMKMVEERQEGGDAQSWCSFYQRKPSVPPVSGPALRGKKGRRSGSQLSRRAAYSQFTVTVTQSPLRPNAQLNPAKEGKAAVLNVEPWRKATQPTKKSPISRGFFLFSCFPVFDLKVRFCLSSIFQFFFFSILWCEKSGSAQTPILPSS